MTNLLSDIARHQAILVIPSLWRDTTRMPNTEERTVTVIGGETVKTTLSAQLTDGAKCHVVRGTHAGKSGVVRDINTSKSGHITITVVQRNGQRFKTLAKNVQIQGDDAQT